MKFARALHHAKHYASDTISVRGIILSALVTMITTGTFQFISDRALAAERQYWQQYRDGSEWKEHWWETYVKQISRCH